MTYVFFSSSSCNAALISSTASVRTSRCVSSTRCQLAVVNRDQKGRGPWQYRGGSRSRPWQKLTVGADELIVARSLRVEMQEDLLRSRVTEWSALTKRALSSPGDKRPALGLDCVWVVHGRWMRRHCRQRRWRHEVCRVRPPLPMSPWESTLHPAVVASAAGKTTGTRRARPGLSSGQAF